MDVDIMKIGVLLGGVSSEREVSLNTGREIVKNLDHSKYDVMPIEINKKEDIIEKTKGIDFAFIALHGKFGEDGVVQSVLETLDIPYSGCGPLSSGICMDKDVTKSILKNANVNTAEWVMAKKNKHIDYEAIEKMGYPVVVKPNSGGSSVATFIIHGEKEIEDAVLEAFKYDEEVMIEKYIKGREITCCMIDGKTLPIIDIIPKSHFFDYESKYQDGGADEIIIELDSPIKERVELSSVKCWESLKCSVYARVDLIVADDIPYVLEINTLPGMTPNSLFPKSAAAYGMNFSQLLDKIIEISLRDRKNK